MANTRYISNGTKNLNVGGYIFKEGVYYLLSDSLAAVVDQIKLGNENVFSALERTPSHGTVNLTNRVLNSDGKIALASAVAPISITTHITKPDASVPTSPEDLATIAEQLDEKIGEATNEPRTEVEGDTLEQPNSYIDLPRSELDAEAKKRDLKVRSNMRNETIVDMLVEHDAAQAETATEAESKTIIQF